MNVETPISSGQATEIYGELCEGNYEVLQPSARIDVFYRKLINKYPAIDSYSEDGVDDCPWSVEIDVSDSAVVMCIVWSRVEEVLAVTVCVVPTLVYGVLKGLPFTSEIVGSCVFVFALALILNFGFASSLIMIGNYTVSSKRKYSDRPG